MIILVLLVAASLSCVHCLELVNNGYENLHIIIKDRVPENDDLLERIQVTLDCYNIFSSLYQGHDSSLKAALKAEQKVYALIS